MSPSTDSIVNLSYIVIVQRIIYYSYYILLSSIVFTVEILLDPGVLAKNNLFIIIRMVESMQGVIWECNTLFHLSSLLSNFWILMCWREIAYLLSSEWLKVCNTGKKNM